MAPKGDYDGIEEGFTIPSAYDSMVMKLITHAETRADNNVASTVVQLRGPLVAGAADTVRAKGIACFGPSAEAAQLEGSLDRHTQSLEMKPSAGAGDEEKRLWVSEVLALLSGQGVQRAEALRDQMTALERKKVSLASTHSANHPFLTLDGWERVEHLEVGTHLASARRIPNQVGRSLAPSMSEAELVLLAHLIGDGCTLARHAIHARRAYTPTEYLVNALRETEELALALHDQLKSHEVAPLIETHGAPPCPA